VLYRGLMRTAYLVLASKAILSIPPCADRYLPPHHAFDLHPAQALVCFWALYLFYSTTSASGSPALGAGQNTAAFFSCRTEMALGTYQILKDSRFKKQPYYRPDC